jgi:LacI family transcriptional regulator
LEDRLDADGYSLLIGNSDSRPERERRHLQLFAAQGVTGVAVAPSGGDSGFLLELVERGVAVVLMEAELEDAPVSSIRVDNEAGARAAVGHLLGLGWSEVVLFNGPHDLRQCAERAAGARAGFAQAGLDPAGLTEVTLTNLNSVGGAAAAAAWFADHPGPTAVFCVNVLVAIGVQRYLTQRGGYNPREWPIAGFDDIEIAADRGVPITSVRQPAYEIGHRAGDLVLTRTPDSPVERVTLLPELVVRASTAA